MVKAYIKPKAPEVVTRDYTINMGRALKGITFKKRAARAIRELKKFAKKEMKTSDVRIDTNLNKKVWANGVKGTDTRLRIRLARRRNEDEDAKEEMKTTVYHVEGTVKGLGTEVVQED